MPIIRPSTFSGPVITSLDFSPDGKLLAVAGFHEAILWKADGSARVARLVGMSDRIESVRFSRDGTKLLVVGGNPVPQRRGSGVGRCLPQVPGIAVPIGFDTLYGGSWSPDGKLIAVGGGRQRLAGVRGRDLQASRLHGGP